MISYRWSKKIKATLIILALLFVGVYGYFQANDLIKGPIIEVKYPKDNLFVGQEKIIIIHGKTKNVSRIHLNDFPIFITPEGYFAEKLPLVGYHNIMKIEAWDRFGRKNTVYRSIIKEHSSSAITKEDITKKKIDEKKSKDENLI